MREEREREKEGIFQFRKLDTHIINPLLLAIVGNCCFSRPLGRITLLHKPDATTIIATQLLWLGILTGGVRVWQH